MYSDIIGGPIYSYGRYSTVTDYWKYLIQKYIGSLSLSLEYYDDLSSELYSKVLKSLIEIIKIPPQGRKLYIIGVG